MKRLILPIIPLIIAGLIAASILHPRGQDLTPKAVAQEVKDLVLSTNLVIEDFCDEIRAKIEQVEALRARFEETSDLSTVIREAASVFKEHAAYFAKLIHETPEVTEGLQRYLSRLSSLAEYPEDKVQELSLRKAQIEGELAVLERNKDIASEIRIKGARTRLAIVEKRITIWERLIPIQTKLLEASRQGVETVNRLIIALEEHSRVADEAYQALAEGEEILEALKIYQTIPEIEDLIDHITSVWDEITSLVDMLLEAAVDEVKALTE